MTSPTPNAAFALSRDPFGQLVFTAAAADGGAPQQHVGVVPVRAFAISAPDEGIALMNAEGHEVAWIARLADLPADSRALVEEELASREFMPEIRAILAVSTFATPSRWTVDTDRGETQFILKGEDDIRRVAGATLLVADSHGVQYLIRDRWNLDRHSKRLLDRFL